MLCCLQKHTRRHKWNFLNRGEKSGQQSQQSTEQSSTTMCTLRQRPELGDDLDAMEIANTKSSTAEIAANAPRYRRKSSTFIDAIHDVPEDKSLAPAQLYSTMSGRLFHSGRIAIVMVGLPARGKT